MELSGETGEIERRIRQIVAEELKVLPSSVSFDRHISQEVGIGSLSLLRIVSRVEKSFGVEFDDEAIFRVQTLSELASMVATFNGTWHAERA